MKRMDLSSLPTESLYKFEAFTGLVLTVGSVVYILRLIDSAYTSLIETGTEIGILKLEVEYVLEPQSRENEKILKKSETDAASLGERAAIIMSGFEELTDSKKAQAIVEAQDILKHVRSASERLNSADGLLKQSNTNIKQALIQLEKIAGKVQLITYQTTKIKLLACVGILAFGIGLFLCLIGFKQWQKVQNDIDAAIHLQLEQKK